MSTEEQQVAFPVPPRWAPLVVEWDVDGTVRWCSAAYAEQLGRTSDEVIGCCWPELVPGEEDVCRRQQAFTVAALATNDLSVTDMPTRVAGRVEWFRWTEEAIRDEAGRLIAVRSTGVEITELYEMRTQVSTVIHGLADARALGRREVLEQLHNGATQQLAAARWAVSAGDRDDAVRLIEDALAAVRASMATLDPPLELVAPATDDEQFSRWTVEQGADPYLPDHIRGSVTEAVSNAVAVLSSTGSVWLDSDAGFDLFGARRDVDLTLVLAVMHPDDRGEVAAATVRALAGEESRVRWRFRHPERGWRQLISWLTPLPVTDGPRLAVALSMDITGEDGDPVRDVLDARLDERRRIAQELHDDALQQLAGLRWVLASCDVGADALAELDALESALRDRMRDTDSPVHRFGLEVALGHLVDHTATPVALRVSGAEHVPIDVGAVLWRSAREALRNVDRHAAARSATLALECERDVARLTVTDDGAGVDDERLLSAMRSGHLGVSSMRESATAAGGTFELRAAAEGGTVLRIELPLAGQRP
ncbi:MAG: PAS domain-containing protein [Ilumatobacteraceae bacterium]